MDLNSTFCRKVELRYLLVFLLSLFLQQQLQAQSVPVYATNVSSQDNADFAANAVDGNLGTRARVRASSGIALGIGAYSGHIELQFPSTLPANTTSYVKIQTDDNLLPALLGGSLGGLLSDVLGTVLIGNQEFTIEARNGTNPVLAGNSQVIGQFATSRLRIVVNGNNDYFIAITPDQPYNRLRLTNRVGSLIGLNNTKRLDVYEAYYIGTPDACGGASYTSFSGTGLNLDLLGLGGAGVSNPHHILDANPNNFSRLSLGILAVAASIEQTAYYDGLSQPTDDFFIRLKVDPSLLALGVANNIQIVASNGANAPQTVNLNSLLNLDLLTLLQGNQVATIRFSPNMPVNRITVRYNSLLNVQLTQSLDLYGITRAPAPPVITDLFTQNPTICEGSTASLIAETGSGTELNWYSQPQGGAILATTASGVPFVTQPLTQNTTFYVAAKRIGCPEESLRIRINVTVIDLPVASDISIPDVLDACSGSVMLSPSSSVGGAVFKYYKDQLKTQEITTGFSGDAGVTYVKNNITGELSITGLTAANSPYTYYISLTVNGLCENAANTLKEVTVNYSSSLTLELLPVLQGCGSVNLRDAILNFDSSSDIQYNFFDSANNPVTAEAATAILTSGIYYIQAVSLSGSCSSAILPVTVTVNPQPTLTITNTNLVVNLGSSVTLDATSDTTITWYDPQGNALPSNTYGPFTEAGFYTFTAIAAIGPCNITGTVSVVVIDGANCPPLTERVYATSQSWGSILTGGVTNAAQAVDGNPQTYSTVTTGIGLLGIGTTWQTLQWPSTIPAGTPLTVKLGSEYSGLIAAGAYSVIGTKRNASGIPVDIGVIQAVSGSLVDLLAGQNTFEFTFVPSNATGPKPYDGVRIIVGSVLSVAQNVRVYEAYYENQVTQVACNPQDVEDLFYGAVDLGLGALTATVGVTDATNAIDADIETYATLTSGAGVLAAAELTVAFRTPTLAGDTVEMILSRPATILDLNVLAGFSIQLFLGNTPVEAPIPNTSPLLSLSLLDAGARARLIIAPQTQIYDRIRIRLGGVASVLDQLRVHDIRRKADTSIIGGDDTNTIEACANDTIHLAITPEDCTAFIWYDAAVGGNVVSTGTSYTIPETQPAGTYTYYIQPVRFGCEIFERGTVTVIVGETAPPTSITDITINGGGDDIICSETGTVVLQATLDSTTTITNPVFYWYTLNGTVQELIPGQTTATLTLNDLVPGTYTYFAGISSDEYCQTAPGDRAEVTFTILPFSQPTDINADDTLVCAGTNAVITPTSAQPNPAFFWFFSNDNSQPITNGTVAGITYAVAVNGTITVSGLTLADSPLTLYVGMSSDATCLNEAGNFKPVVITVNDSGTPTTLDTTQDFCQADAPTVADIQVNEPNVIWYDAVSGGNLLAATTPLIDGIYYAGFDATTGCVSSVRLAVTVTVNDAPTPTTTDTTQEFCIALEPTIASIQVNETGIIWYSAPTGGTALDAASALVNGAVYYAALVDAASGCESSVRLAITVTLNDAETPSTDDKSQDFCLTENATIADIQVNEPNVVWYDAVTGGNILPPTTALVNGATYYASLTDAGNGCESSVRLAVLITITDPATPTTTDTTQDFCLVNNPTIADIQVNETDIVWYDAENGGTALAEATALTNGAVYYAAQFDPVTGCESSVRLAITVTITDPATPTTTDTTQDFCLASAPTIADIDVNEPNIVWYDAATNGNSLDTTTALVNGAIYYAALLDANTGCESSIRLGITVTVNNASTPTTTDDSQDFCLADSPVVADIDVNEADVVFYTTPTGGTALAPDTALVSGNYYASFGGGIFCESITRLVITVTVNDPATPTTTDATQEFCQSANPTVADIEVNESDVVWYASETGGTPLNPAAPLAEGNYYAAQVDPETGCESSIRLLVAISFIDNATAVISGGNAQACVFEQVTYTANAGMTDYVWTVTNGSIVDGGQSDDDYVTVSWMAINTGTVGVSYTNSCGETNTASRTISVITCSDITISKTVDNLTPMIGDDVTFTITVSNVGTGNFLNVVVNESLPNGYEYVSSTVSTGTYSNVSGIWTIPVLDANESATLTVTATVLPTGNYLNTASITSSNPEDSDVSNNSDDESVDPICLIVYNEFSPNGDGANELFRIDCIENYPNNKLEVYNRYGALVYTKNHYVNDWDGTANVSGALSKDDELPTGTYYYILDTGVDFKKSGWLSIIR